MGEVGKRAVQIQLALRKISFLFFFLFSDNTLPVITGCPNNIVENIPVTQSGTVISYTIPSATDNSNQVQLVTNPTPPGFFPVGTNVVTYTFRDPSGNEATCQFTVLVTAGT